jgi:S-DNA-T family DNA segregation ATPase FtsK/SpoIIIE
MTTMWTLPPLDVLEPEDRTPIAVRVDCQGVANALREHKIGVVEVGANIGPQAVRYLIRLEPGVLPSKVERATPAVGLALGAAARYAGVLGGRVAVEVARAERAGVTLSRVLGDPAATNATHALPIPVGVDLDGNARMDDLARLPHLIVAGTTGAGKSAYLHAVVTSLLMRTTPDDVRLHLVDPKHVELTAYEGAPHVADVVTTASGALDLLRRFVEMMDTRYAMLKDEGVRDIDAYNAKMGVGVLERHVVVVEELADLLMTPVGPAIGTRLERIAQLGRAAGLHLVVATQRPSAKVLPELLRANVPARAVFAVSTPSDGLVALGTPGAYGTLTGKGDGLFKVPGVGDPVRFQSPFVSAAEVARVVEWWKRQVPVTLPDGPPADHDGDLARASDPGAELRQSLDLDAMRRDHERAEAMREVGLTPSYRTPEDVLAGYGFTPEVVGALTAVITDGVVAGIRKELGL